MLPPRDTAWLIVTKSPTTAPWLLSVAVMVLEPLVAEKVMLFVEVLRVGVISAKVPPNST